MQFDRKTRQLNKNVVKLNCREKKGEKEVLL
jgi:hypothetical protein